MKHIKLGLALVLGVLLLGGAWGMLAGGDSLPAVYAEAALTAPTGCVAGPHTGAISGTQDWCAEDNPHYLTGDVTVPDGMTLTLRAGVVVRGNTATRIRVLGHLEAVGTAGQPITLTSSADTGPGEWEGLYFEGGTGHLDYVTIRYAGQNDGWAYASIRLNGSDVTIENSQVLSGSIAGQADSGVHLCCGSSSAVINNTLFAGNGNDLDDYAVNAYSSGDVLTLTNNVFLNNPGYPAMINPPNLHRVGGNSFSGNGLDRIVIRGNTTALIQDATLTDQVGLEAYQLTDANLVVPAGMTLTVDPGVMMMFNSGRHLRVNGNLVAVGTPAQPITFTSSANTGPGEWGGFYVSGGSAEIRHATLRYAGQSNGFGYAGINLQTADLILEDSQIRDIRNDSQGDFGVHLCCVGGGASATVDNVLFANIGDSASDIGILSITDGNPITVTNSTFENIAGYPVQVDSLDVQRITDNHFANNGFDRILVVAGPGGNVVDGAHLTVQDGLEGYELQGGLTVPDGDTFTVDPGVMVMSNAAIYVVGHMDAVGTPGAPITFTSSANSAPEQWAGIYIQQGTADMAYATLRYGGGSYGSGARAALIVQNAAHELTTLDHCTLRDNAAASLTDMALNLNGGHVLLSHSQVISNGNGSNDYGVSMGNGGALTATHSIIADNAGTGLYADGSRTHLTCSTVSGNGSDGIRLNGSATVFDSLSSAIVNNAGIGLSNPTTKIANALYNWWGDASGPGGVGSGSGDEVSGNVLYDPWLPFQTCFADLALDKDAAPDPVMMRDPLYYTITVTNQGPGAAQSITVTDELDASALWGPATISQGNCVEVGGVLTCALGDLDVGQTATVTLVATPTLRGTLVNTATVALASYDAILSSNVDATESTVEARMVYLPLVLRNN